MDLMELRNLMEAEVDEILSILLEGRDDLCLCDRCVLDMKSYALNRLPARYIVSERGLTHKILDTVREAQTKADVVQVVAEAIRTVGRRPREGHDRRRKPPAKNDAGRFFRIVGSVHLDHGLEPAVGARIRLVDHLGRTVPMRDAGWDNPVTLGPHTMGIFGFWPTRPPTRRDRWRIEIRFGRRNLSVPVILPQGGRRPREHLHIPPVILDGGASSSGRRCHSPDNP